MNIEVYKDPNSLVKIEQLPMQRDWMDLTFDRHAYQCFPVSLANRLGYAISFSTDISFIWDGINSSEDRHVRVLRGGNFVSSKRANRTISFETGLYFSPNKNISLLTMPPPNIFLDGLQCISTIISSTALVGSLPIALMITKSKEEITIPSGTIIASVLPVNLNEINNTKLTIKNKLPDFISDKEWNKRIKDRGDVSQELNSQGKWTHFYRNAIDHNGDPYGEHEAKKILMRVYHED